ncbi:MAG: hypothetical protein WB646_06765 [Steroidobacteraceae bacterium]
MTSARILLAVGAVAVGVHYAHRHSDIPYSPIMPGADQSGFVSLPPAQGQDPDTVYVVAAVNCPHEAAQRADRLAADLRNKGIPVVRTSNVSFAGSVDDSTVKRMNTVMTGPLPIVFVHGKARPAAALEDVEAEYRSSER